MRYFVEYQNDVGPDDDGFWEWWEVIDSADSTVICKCSEKENADKICDLLNKAKEE